MIKLLLYGGLLYLGWKAYQVVRNGITFERHGSVEGKPDSTHIEINDEDIEDAEFKDLKE